MTEVNYKDLAHHILTKGMSFEDVRELGLKWINGTNDGTLSFGYFKALKDGGGDIERECEILELYLRMFLSLIGKVHVNEETCVP